MLKNGFIRLVGASVVSGVLVGNVLAAPPDDPYYQAQTPRQVGLQQINPEDAWACSKGKGVVVAVLDTGLASGLEDGPVTERLLSGMDFIASASGSTETTVDPNGHGTHLSGIIGAHANNGTGIAGIAPAADIMPIRVLNNDLGHQVNGSGASTALSTIQGLQAAADYARDNQVNVVINASFGSRLNNGYCAALKAIDDDPRARVLVVAAAMNSGDTTPHYPAYCVEEGVHNLLSVGSVDSSGPNKDRLSSFSNRGCWVNSFAPGRQVISTWSPSLAPPTGAVTLVEGGNYATWSGTSQAAAMVTGAAAVLWSMAPDKAAAEIVALLQQTSDSVTGLQCADEVNGRKRGRINLGAAMAQVADPKCSNSPPVNPMAPQTPGNFSVQ